MTKELLMIGLMTCQVRDVDKDVYLVSDKAETHGRFITAPQKTVPVSIDNDTYVRKVNCGDLVYRYKLITRDSPRIKVKVSLGEE